MDTVEDKYFVGNLENIMLGQVAGELNNEQTDAC